MNALLRLLVIVIPPLWLWSWWRKRPGRIEATDAAIGVRPTRVMLPDEGSRPEERPARRRTGETQELRRRVVHGPYRAIDRGAPSGVEMWRQT